MASSFLRMTTCWFVKTILRNSSVVHNGIGDVARSVCTSSRAIKNLSPLRSYSSKTENSGNVPAIPESAEEGQTLIGSLLAKEYFEMANAKLLASDVDAAIPLYLTSLEQEQTALAWFNLATAYIHADKLGEAMEALEASLYTDPDFADGYANLGTLYATTGRPKEAIVSYQSALLINDQDWRTHFNLGVIFESVGQFEEAVNSYKTASNINHEVPQEYLRNAMAKLAALQQPPST